LNKSLSVSGDGVGQANRMAGKERRLQIVRVAMQLFSRRGFGGTTTKEIAHAAGVSEAMVFRHFATKEELYSAILDHKACSGDAVDPREVVAEALEQKNDRAVFEKLALNALQHHECDPEFQRLLLHSALEGHELAQMFWEKFVKRVYEFLSAYIRERQRDGALIEMQPAVIVRAFIGMVIHHSLNNNLWDQKRTLLRISNEAAARAFTDILLNGISRKKSSQPDGGRTNERPRPSLKDSHKRLRISPAAKSNHDSAKAKTKLTSARLERKKTKR
jgi:AcrR family transcriptional regulator